VTALRCDAHLYRAGGPDAGAVLDELAQRLTRAEEVCAAGECSSETRVNYLGMPDEVGPRRVQPRPPTSCQPTTRARCGAATSPPKPHTSAPRACLQDRSGRQTSTHNTTVTQPPRARSPPALRPAQVPERARARSLPQVGLAIQALKSRVEGARAELLPRRRFAFAARPRAPAGEPGGAAAAAAGAACSTAAAAMQPAGDEPALSSEPARSRAAAGPTVPGRGAEPTAACDAAGGGASDTLDTDWCSPSVA